MAMQFFSTHEKCVGIIKKYSNNALQNENKQSQKIPLSDIRFDGFECDHQTPSFDLKDSLISSIELTNFAPQSLRNCK